MIIDFHTHAFPEGLAKRALTGLSSRAGNMPFYTDGTPDGLLRHMDESGVDKAVVLQIATRKENMTTINNAAEKGNSERLIYFGSVHPLAENALEELDRIAGMGLLGVKFHPEYQDFDIDDKRCEPVYRRIGELGLITTLHMGRDLGFFGHCHCAPEMLERVMPLFGSAPVIAAHSGGYAMWEETMSAYTRRDNLYFDTSFSHVHLPPKALRAIIDKHGAEKVLFGSDSPWSPMKGEMSFLDSVGLSETERELILHKNAERLLGL
ncbi:MAG: amidohydrolase family protein [Eubacteriales bacterium]|nr:amidohydrolase family protein [Eubacteriales bacterium]MDD3882651.1 amidohydrolase family protein [Eubacteriales bacterium]MDD4512777.1 amidohydrolase family protein [Eubacteriales bacterium]